LPEELIFDSRLTTYANLSELNRMGVQFITLRRRTRKLLHEIAGTPLSACPAKHGPPVERASSGIRRRVAGFERAVLAEPYSA
jgi:hypothetical protein